MSKRITLPVLTKYERARILGTRALQISNGAPILVDAGKEVRALVIAEMELQARVIPIIVRRRLPNGKTEEWRLSELRV